jgi:DNA topoisomerase-3
VPAWKRWSPILLRPEGLYDTRPAEGGNKTAKLKAIREALRTAKRVWLATDCDREGQLIGQEILEHYKYRGEIMRVLFTELVLGSGSRPRCLVAARNAATRREIMSKLKV